VLLHHEDYFFACSHAASCLSPCAVTSSLARRPFFCFFLLSLSAPFFFSVAFCRALQSPVTSPARSVFLLLFAAALQTDRSFRVFFCLFVVRRAHFFPEQSSVRSLPPAACAGLFFYFCMQTRPCAVTSLAHSSFSACRVCQRASFFLCMQTRSVRSLPWRTELFFACSRCVWSLQLCCARRLSLFIFSVQLLLLAPCIFSFFLASLKCRERRHFFEQFFWSLRSKTS
jgi:hypothetical protein